jgi:threonine 3-dehydrogenase
MKISEEVDTLKMKVVVKDKPEVGFTLQEKVITTDLLDDEVLIKIITASFCGTDYHIYLYDNWAKNRLKLPLTVGHEFSGEVIKVGKDVTRVQVGDIVSAETHIVCGECEFCRRGEGHICEATKIIGVDTDGCFANYIKIPAANCIVNSKDVNPLILSVLEPLGNAVHTMNHFNVKDKDVVILGCGPIGIMAVDVSRALGAKKVIAIEVKEYRRNLAKELGADVVIDPLSEDVIKRVLEETNGKGADIVGEFSGNKRAIEQAFKYVKAGGGMSMLGLPAENIEVDLSKDIINKGLSIYGVTGRRIYETWDQVKELIDNKKLNIEKVITHKFLLRDINEAAKIMGSGMCGKIILIPEEINE